MARAGHRYPAATRLLITADAGGVNGYRVRAWKTELADFAHTAGLEVTVCHFPPGTPQWNKIEHRLSSRISTNWRGRPLTSHEVMATLPLTAPASPVPPAATEPYIDRTEARPGVLRAFVLAGGSWRRGVHHCDRPMTPNGSILTREAPRRAES